MYPKKLKKLLSDVDLPAGFSHLEEVRDSIESEVIIVDVTSHE